MSGKGILVIFGVIVLVSICLFTFIFTFSTGEIRVELAKEAGSALLQLGLAGTLGTYAKYLLDEYAKDRQREQENAERVREARETNRNLQIQALNLLTTSYWQIKKSLHIIDAHRSAKSYGEQVREIIDFRLAIQQLNNEIGAGFYGFQKSNVISDCLTKMDDELEKVVKEWKEVYLELSQLQKQDEATDKPQEKKVPKKISALPALQGIRENDFAVIHGYFEGAVNPIREQLAQTLYQT